MKKIISLLLTAVLVLGLCACGEAAPKETEAAVADTLQVGFAREIVMPKTGKPELDGTAAGRIMTDFMDNLTVTCVALKGINGETVLVYTTDRKDSQEQVFDECRVEIAKATGIAEDHIMLGATHTHSAPKFSGWTGAEQYAEDFEAAMVKVGQDALADLSPAEGYYGSVQTENCVYVRHYKLIDGTVTSSGVSAGDPSIVGHPSESDQELQAIRFDRGEGKKDVILMSFNSHPTWFGGVSETNMSADYPAPTREFIEANGDYLVAFFLGDAGNQGPSTKYMPEIASAPKDYREHGQRLGQYVLDLIPNMTKATGDEIKLMGQQYAAKTNKEKIDMVAQATEVMNVYQTQGRDAALVAAEKYGFYQHLEASAIINRARAGDTTDVWMNVLAIGNDRSFVFAPYEMFSESGSYIRSNTPYGITLLSTCTNGAVGYLASDAAFEYGCYESFTGRLARGSAEELAEEYVSMLTEMKNG